VLNFITGPGSEVGGAIVQHKLTRFISFTGSRDVGLWIFEQASKTHKGQIWMKRLVAEMGGKDSILVDRECDLEKAVDAVVASAFGYQGQKCSACSRAIVHEAVYDEFVKRIVPKVEAIKIGHPTERTNAFGPMVDGAAKRKTLDYIETGKKEGRLLIGGTEGPKGGHYVKPTVFADVKPTAKIAQEEIFGPVLAIIKVKDFAEGLAVANNGLHHQREAQAGSAEALPRRQLLHQPQVHRCPRRRAPVRRLQHVGHGQQGRRPRLHAAVPAGEDDQREDRLSLRHGQL
jgi:1-pyrroline-5-carboxylate dehydrogenase